MTGRRLLWRAGEGMSLPQHDLFGTYDCPGKCQGWLVIDPD